MKYIEVRERKFVLIIGILDIVVFSFFYMMAFFSSFHDADLTSMLLFSLLFAPFICLGIYMILTYFRKRIVFYHNEFTVQKAFTKVKHYHYCDIERIVIVPAPAQVHYILYNSPSKRIIAFEENMNGCYDALELLGNKNIRIDSWKPAASSKPGSAVIESLKWHEKLPFIAGWNLNDNAQFIKEKYSLKRICLEKKLTRMIGYLFILLDVCAFILRGKWMFLCITLVLLFSWLMYLYLYPRVSIEKIKNQNLNQYFVEFPVAGICMALLSSLITADIFNFNEPEFFRFAGIYGLILLVPFLFKLGSLHRRGKISRIVLVCFCVFTLSFSTAMPINYLATYEPSRHEVIIVADKNTTRRKTTHYYIYADWKEPNQRFSVAKSTYNECQIGSHLYVCIRKSLFGFQYWTIHS